MRTGARKTSSMAHNQHIATTGESDARSLSRAQLSGLVKDEAALNDSQCEHGDQYRSRADVVRGYAEWSRRQHAPSGEEPNALTTHCDTVDDLQRKWDQWTRMKMGVANEALERMNQSLGLPGADTPAGEDEPPELEPCQPRAAQRHISPGETMALDDETIARKYYWAHRCSGMGNHSYGDEELLKHANEPLLAMRELRAPLPQEEGAISPPGDQCYMLYEYDGSQWSTGEWSQKEYPRAIIVIPRLVRDYGAFEHKFMHLGCEFKVCDHMSFNIFHLEDRAPHEAFLARQRDGSV